MKRIVNASANQCLVKIIYCHDINSATPELRSMTITGFDEKDALMKAIDTIDLPFLGLDFNEPDSFTYDDLVDNLIYYNENTGNITDYIFQLTVDDDVVIDYVAPEENY